MKRSHALGILLSGYAWALVFLLIARAGIAADVTGKTNVRTNTKTDVQAQQSGQDGTTIGQVSANNTAQAGAGAGGEQVLPAIVQSALPTYSTNGNLVGLTVDASGRLYVNIDSTVTVGSNLKQVNGSALSATNPVFSQLTDGTTVYTGAKTGQLPTALGQNTMANSLTVAIASNQSTLSVSQGAPTGAAIAVPAVVNIASGATTTIVLKSALSISQPTKAYKIRITALAQAVCLLQYNDNATITKLGYVALSPSTGTGEWACVSGFPCGVTTSATATTQQYEASCTNLLDVAQDFHGEIEYCQAASGC